MPGDVDCLICGCRTLILFCLSVFGFGSFRFECVFVRSVSWLSVLCVVPLSKICVNSDRELDDGDPRRF